MDPADKRALARHGARARAEPSEVGTDFLDETIAFWQPRTDRMLSREDARQIAENVTGFMRLLHEWDRKRHASEQAPPIAPE